jgi:hypothetical protein
MKRLLLFTLTVLAFSLPLVEKAKARTDVSIDFFYNNLGNDGSWVELANYGYAWQPSVAISNTGWRPYADGYWAYTDVGWTWVSYEDFGWATYHYGRWVRLRERGWFWVPGYEWGPAWVSWRTGGDYVGWAPLPPRGGSEVVYEGQPIYGAVDVDYDIGPLYYNFVDVRYIGEPVLRERIFEPTQNVTYMERTVNVTNITYNNSQVYNYGPDYNRLSAYSTRPIQRLTLQRETNADFSTAAVQSSALTRVQGDRLMVAAPQRLERPAAPAAPKVVKEKIANPTVEHGWSGAGDQAKIAQLRQKIKGEDRKQIPPPDITPKPGAAAAASTAASPATAASAATPASPPSGSAAPGTGAMPATAASPAMPANPAATTPQRRKGKDKRVEHAPPFATPAESASATGPAAPAASAPPQSGKGKGRNKGVERTQPTDAQPAATAGEPAAPVTTPMKPAGKGKGRNARPDVAPQAPAATAAPATPETAPPAAPATQPDRAKGHSRKDRGLETAPPVAAPPATVPQPNDVSVTPPGRGKGRGDANREAREAAGGVPPQQPPAGAFSAEGQGRGHRAQQQAPPTSGPEAPAPLAVPGEQHPQKGGKPKKGGPPETSATPGQ